MSAMLTNPADAWIEHIAAESEKMPTELDAALLSASPEIIEQFEKNLAGLVEELGRRSRRASLLSMNARALLEYVQKAKVPLAEYGPLIVDAETICNSITELTDAYMQGAVTQAQDRAITQSLRSAILSTEPRENREALIDALISIELVRKTYSMLYLPRVHNFTEVTPKE
jgi:hypothetical protein